MYLIPFEMIQQAFGRSAQQPEARHMEAAQAVMRLLLQQVVMTMPFDEEAYLTANPDVATAIRRGEVADAHSHYVADGYFEGREGAADTFDEAWYLKRNTDVAHGISSGQWMSGRHHYRHQGVFEWRSPNRMAEADVEHWRTLLDAFPATVSETVD